MLLNFTDTLRTARSQAIISALDANASPGYIELYTAPKPAKGAAITTQDLLGTLVLSKPSGTTTNGVFTFDVIDDDVSADNTGDIAWGRAYDGAGTFVMDMDAGDNASNAVLKFVNVSVIAGGVIRIASGTITEGNV